MSVTAAAAAAAPSEPDPNAPEKFRDPRLELTDAQWDLIFEKCGTVMKLRSGDIVIEEGQVVAKIFQVLRGRCRVETEDEVIVSGVVTTEVHVAGRVEVGEMFGEKSFLFGGTTTASVIAEVDETEVHALDKAQLERLFFVKPELAGGFYKTLAESIEGRLSQRNTAVLLKYAALLGRKVQDGDINGEQLFTAAGGGGGGAGPKNPALVRVAKPQRKDSLGMISASSVQAKLRPAGMSQSVPLLAQATPMAQQAAKK
jgi:CRP-like cAMP-binding protein